MALGLLIAIVVTGAAVRLTGSGLGCDDWPNCNDERLVDVSSSHAAIEQVNRLFTGLVAAAVIAAVLGSLWRRPRRRDLVWLSLGLVAGVLGQIVLGGILVSSTSTRSLVQGHMILSLALVGTAVVLLQRAGEPDGVAAGPAVSATSPPPDLGAGRRSPALAIVAGTVVTGAGPHAGDEDVAAPRRRHLLGRPDPRHHRDGRPRRSPSRWRVRPPAAPRPTGRSSGPVSSWIFVGLLQAAIGYIQYFNDVPALLVGVHVAGATALWAMTVWLVLARRRPLVPPSRRVAARDRGRSCTLSRPHDRAALRTRVPRAGCCDRCCSRSCAILGFASLGRVGPRPGGRRGRRSIRGRVFNEFEQDGERVREPVADVRIVVEDRGRRRGRRSDRPTPTAPT